MSAAPYFMTTTRLGFRCWRVDDLPLALALWGDPEVSRFLGGPFSPEQVRKRLEDEMALFVSHNVQYWPVFLLDSGEHVGCAGLRPYKLDEGIYELGVHLRPEFWRQGLAPEAAGGVRDYAFQTLRAEGLFAGHHPANTASGRMLEKAGFRFIGEQFYEPLGWIEPAYMLMKPR